MSSILEALEKKKKSQTTEVGRGSAVSVSPTPPSIRVKTKWRRILVLLVAAPVLAAAAWSGSNAYRMAASKGEGTIKFIREPVTMVHQTPEEPDAKPVEDERVQRLTSDLESLQAKLQKLMSERQQYLDSQGRLQIPGSASRPPVADGGPSTRPPDAGGGSDTSIIPPDTGDVPGMVTVPPTDTSHVAQIPPDHSPGSADQTSITEPVEPGDDSAVGPDSTPSEPTSAPAPKGPPDIPLQGIAAGPAGPCAIIDGQLLEVGDIVNDWEISEIGDGYIRVRGWDRKIYLH